MDTHVDRRLHLYRYRDLLERNIVTNRVTLNRWIENKEFPEPIRIGPNTIAWRVSEVEAWLERCAGPGRG